MLLMQEVRVPSLVRELRSHMPCSAAKNLKKKKKETNAMEEVTWIKPVAVSTFLSLPTLAAFPGDLHLVLLLRELPGWWLLLSFPHLHYNFFI